MYTSESGVIHHFDNAYGNNLPKTPLENLYAEISYDPGSHEPDPGPQEKSTKKSCVSFETECIKHYPISLTLYDLPLVIV